MAIGLNVLIYILMRNNKYINIKMRKALLTLLVAAAVVFSGCSGLSKMKRNSGKIRYQAVPDPVEVRDEKVVVNFTASVPAKYFDKGVALFIQPVFTWEGGSTPLDPITVKGENVSGPGSTINYTTGGRFTYNDALDYKPGMETGRVTLAPVGYKTSTVDDEALFADEIVNQHKGVTFPTVLISDGVNITTEWIDIRGNISIAPLNYNKKQGVVETADIYFPNGTSILDWNFDMNVRFDAQYTVNDLKRIMLENGLPKQITITGWASPEGEETANVGVSKNRADIATNELRRVLDDVLTVMARRAKVKPQDLEYYKHEQLKKMVITTRSAGEDWVHFVVMVEESNIQDRHAIVNVVETQQNLVKREQMIKNYSVTYPQLERDIFPNLRRAQIALYYSEARQTDVELAIQATLNPSKLSYDELMYAAYILYASSRGLSIIGERTWRHWRSSGLRNASTTAAATITIAPAKTSAAIFASATTVYLTGLTSVSCNRFAARSRANAPVADDRSATAASAATPPSELRTTSSRMLSLVPSPVRTNGAANIHPVVAAKSRISDFDRTNAVSSRKKIRQNEIIYVTHLRQEEILQRLSQIRHAPLGY